VAVEAAKLETVRARKRAQLLPSCTPGTRGWHGTPLAAAAVAVVVVVGVGVVAALAAMVEVEAAAAVRTMTRARRLLG